MTIFSYAKCDRCAIQVELRHGLASPPLPNGWFILEVTDPSRRTFKNGVIKLHWCPECWNTCNTSHQTIRRVKVLGQKIPKEVEEEDEGGDLEDMEP